MATETVNDWVVSVGMDTSKVEQGAKRIEKIMRKLAKTQARLLPRTLEQRIKLNTSDFDRQMARFQNTRINVNLDTAKVNKQLRNLKGQAPAQILIPVSLNTTKFDKQLRKIREQLQQQVQIPVSPTSSPIDMTRPPRRDRPNEPRESREPREPRQPRGDQPFNLPVERQLRLANTLDSVVRRANRQLGNTSSEFQEINREAQRLRGLISGISSRPDLERFNNSIRVMRDEVTSSAQAMRRLNGTISRQQALTNSLSNSFNNLGARYASVFLAVEGARAFFQIGSQFDSINSSLMAASGSAEQAGKDFEFIKNTSMSLGIGLKDVAEGFAKIGAAGRASGLTSGEIQNTFLDISKSVRAFGLSSDRASLVFLGFQQMLSKGVVSMQELRQQIGEQLPTALPIAKEALKEMGSEFTNFQKAIESGTIQAEEFVPIFARLLRENVQESGALEASLNTITAAQQRFTSTIQLLTVSAFQAGGKKGIVFFFNQMTEAATRLQPLFRNLGRVVGVLGVILGGLIRVTGLILAPFIALIDLFIGAGAELIDLGVNFDHTNEKMGVMAKTVHILARVFAGLAAAILAPFAALEFFADKMEDLQKKHGALGALGVLANPDRFDKRISEDPVERLRSKFAIGTGAEPTNSTASNVNSGNNIEVNIDATGNDADGIGDVVSDFLQDMFSGATPNN